uniref:Ferritin n=1 Tax=Sus scrofa TaxID=9823 RepID=A0A287B9Z5_PIG
MTALSLSQVLYASYIYLSMSDYFFFFPLYSKGVRLSLHSREKKEHAKEVIKLQNQRGSQIFLQYIKKPDHDDWKNGLNAMECSLLELHKLATHKNDSHLCDFIETRYLNEQVKSIKELGDRVTSSCNLAIWHGRCPLDFTV